MSERLVLMGPRRALVGVVTTPDPSRASCDGPMVLLLNAGLIHRVGPNRIYVKLARRLSGLGITSVRFDLSGRGDSPATPSSTPFRDSALQDVRRAMDDLESLHGAKRFALIGICSGGELALQVASFDRRVVGVGVVNGALGRVRPTEGQLSAASMRLQVRYYLSRLLKRESWVRLVRGRSDVSAIGRLIRGLSRRVVGRVRRRPRSSDDDGSEIQGLVERGVSLLAVFSDGSLAAEVSGRTLKDEAPRLIARGGLRVERVERTDHVFTLLAAQERLIDAVVSWMRDAWELGGSKHHA